MLRKLGLNIVAAFLLAHVGSAPCAHAETKSLPPPTDFNQLFNSCEDDWDKYDADLTKLRSTLKREIDALSQDDYMRRYLADDEMIRFVRLHWPSLLSEKDSGWDFYKGCSERNWETRKLLNSAGATKAEKTKRIDELEACVKKLFGPKGKGPATHPFDRMVKCYRKRAR